MPKFLESAELAELNSMLDSIQAIDSVVHGRMENYSLKGTSNDKRLEAQLSSQILEEVTSPTTPPGSARSPFGSLEMRAPRKTLIHLIEILNMSFNDMYDFTGLRGEHFVREPDLDRVLHLIFSTLETTIDGFRDNLQSRMMAALQEEIDASNCDIYSYSPADDENPLFVSSTVWTFNFFFHNKKLNRVLYMVFWARRPDGLSDSMFPEEYGPIATGVEAMGTDNGPPPQHYIDDTVFVFEDPEEENIIPMDEH